MLRRVSILSFIVALFGILFGESLLSDTCMTVEEDFNPHTETLIAELNAPTHADEILSGSFNWRLSNAARRLIQRTTNKRLENAKIVLKSILVSLSVIEYPYYAIKSNVLGGVANGSAFYSLCCLRI